MRIYSLKYKIILLIALVLSFVSVSKVSVFALTPTPAKLAPNEAPNAPINLTLSPMFVNLSTDPDKEVSSQLRVTNNNSFTESYKIKVAKYQVGSGGERLNIVPLSKEDKFGEWVNFSDSEFNVASNQTKTIKFTIAPPKDAALGYYYAFIIQRVKEQAAGKTPLLTGAPAFTAILDVRSPNAKRELQLVSFSTDQPFYEYLPTTFNITFKNTGNLHIVPHGDIFIDQGSKKDVAILKINEGQGNILPGATRTYTAIWDDGMIVNVAKTEHGKNVLDSKGKEVTTVKVDTDKPLSKFRIGSYKANLLAVYDNGKRDVPLESHLSFWVLPWKIIIAALVIIIAPVLIYHLVSRKRKK